MIFVCVYAKRSDVYIVILEYIEYGYGHIKKELTNIGLSRDIPDV